MNCLHPRKKKIVDAITGEVREITFPCGHCINCQADFQDMWSIRLQETAKHYKRMIYDTLTLSPYSKFVKTKIDYTRPDKFGCFYGTTVKFDRVKCKSMMKGYATFHKLYPRYSYEVWEKLKKSNFKVYELDKSDIQDWLKRGREQYKRDHNGARLDISYYVTLEYCPTTSRPHCHLLMFGINQADYRTYFGEPLRQQFGFHCPTFILYDAGHTGDVNRIVKYVAKYVCKGDYDSPLVKEGLQQKPWRLMSKGIGEGLLSLPRYDVFKSSSMQQFKDYYKPSKEVYENTLQKMKDNGVSEEKIHKYIEEYQDKCKNVEFGLAFYKCDDIDNLTEEDIQNLYCYYDNQGYMHKLPRYYIQKLFGGTNNEKNILQSKIQTILQQSARLHTNKVIQKEALEMGVLIPDEWCNSDSSTWELSPGTLFMVLYNHSVRQAQQASALAERRELRLKNFYNRPLSKVENGTIKI